MIRLPRREGRVSGRPWPDSGVAAWDSGISGCRRVFASFGSNGLMTGNTMVIGVGFLGIAIPFTGAILPQKSGDPHYLIVIGEYEKLI